MSEALHAVAELSPVKRALHEIRVLRARVEELEAAQQEPIAIIGAGLRFPGGAIDEQSFWDLLARGTDAITEIPRERWDWRAYFNADADAPGSMCTQHGGFLEGIDRFDAAFFGISPREAVAMDPQHRLTLEVGWEALERAGYAPATLQHSATGVFLGIGNIDYGRSALADLEHIDAYTASGNSPAMLAGRLSYVLGLHGPSLAVDTSCSSSLVAVHLACASLRAGECNVALAGGVNLITSPESNIALSKAHMMAPDGHCKTFDEAADGYVRSEGCAVIVLRRLSDAMRDGDRILAVVRGSAVNHDGRSGGLTAPNGPAQAAVIRRALEAANVKPGEIGYLETHGTGTALGDPIEVETLGSVLGVGRAAESPLAIGSVKTNIGHAEAASGIAGLMKTVLALQHQTIPPSLHLKQKNSHIDWDRLPVVVPTRATEWKPLNGHRYAAVSSFGFSGTNAHVVLEEAPQREAVANSGERSRHLLTVSARTEAGLDELRVKYAAALRGTSAAALADVCFTANAGRTHFAHRVAVVGETAEQMALALEGAESTRSLSGVVDAGAADRVCFLFTGQGSQYVGMGRELYASSAVFRAGIDRCAAAWLAETGESLIEVLYPAAGAASRMGEARCAQPALFAFEYAMAELWRSWGMEPGVVLGHSLGEYVAAVVAGVWSVEDGLKLVCARARLMDGLTAPGAMRSIVASVARVERAIAGLEGEVAIAAVNGPESVVISGAAAVVTRVAEELEAEGIRTRALEVTHGFHSPLLEPILEEFEACARQVTYHAPRIRMISNLTGRAAGAGEVATAAYWRNHMRQAVLFDAGLKTALDAGCTTFLEVGPQPHLKALAVRTDEALEPRIGVSLRRPRGEWEQMLETLAKFYAEGQPIDWMGFEKGYRRQRVALPTYPFERQRYWLGTSDAEWSQRIWERGTGAAVAQSRTVPIGVRVEAFPAKWESLKRLTIAEILRTLQELGAFSVPGTSQDAKSLAASCGVVPEQTRLMGRWMSLLADAGYLEREGSRFVNREPLPKADLDSAWREAEAALSDDPALRDYIRNCSKHLSGVLVGTTSPLETLFPGGSPDLARNLYENSGGTRYANLIVAAAVQAACLATPASRRLRILELGGGTGATTAAVLPALLPERVSYTFTDVSDLFLHRASARFAQYPCMRYGLLDIESEEQMAQHRGSFDLVIAANVVHATRNLDATLSGIAGLLTPGGTIVFVESTQYFEWHEMTTGLIEGWQKSEEELRTATPLLGVEEWTAALRRAGFENVVSAPEEGSAAGDIGVHILMASGAAATRPAAGGMAFHAAAALSVAGAAFAQQSAASVEAAPLITALFEDAPRSEHHGILLQAVCEEIARVLRLPATATPRKQDRLMDLGMDSLMAVELRNRLAARLGLDSIPATLIFDYPTPDAITGYLLQGLQTGDPASVEIASAPAASREKLLTAEEVADLSDDDVANLLRSHLSR
jgi:acyl transferase domain-containing protein/SAM-dependent methyltransferase